MTLYEYILTFELSRTNGGARKLMISKATADNVDDAIGSVWDELSDWADSNGFVLDKCINVNLVLVAA